MGTTTRRIRGALVASALVLALGACAGGNGGNDPGADGAGDGAGAAAGAAPPPELRPYCDAIMRVQSEQSAPDAGAGGIAASSESARRGVAEIVGVAPPDIALEWQAVQAYTEQSLALLEATGGDAARIDRAALQGLQRDAAPAVDRIRTFTEQGCGITFQVPG